VNEVLERGHIVVELQKGRWKRGREGTGRLRKENGTRAAIRGSMEDALVSSPLGVETTCALVDAELVRARGPGPLDEQMSVRDAYRAIEVTIQTVKVTFVQLTNGPGGEF
jgi:hypothetical protein